MRRAAGLVFVMSLFGSLGCASVRPVDERALFRSGQLSPQELEAAIDQHGIKTVINLRGFEPGCDWYRQQAEVVRRKQVHQIDLALDPQNPDREEIIRLLESYQTMPRPMLIHGRSSHTTVGFAAALYRTAILEQPTESARKELPLWENERLAWAGRGGADRFFDAWQGADHFYDHYGLPIRQAGLLVSPEPVSEPKGEHRSARLATDATGAGPRRADYILSSQPGSVEGGRWISDYQTVMVAGPAPDGPSLIGRTPLPWRPARPSAAKSPAAPDQPPTPFTVGTPQPAK